LILAAVKSKLKFLNVTVQVLHRNLVEGAYDPTF